MTVMRYSLNTEEGVNEVMGVIVGKVVAIFLIIAVGLAANKIGVLPTESKKYITDLLILITTPCMVLTSISSKELTDDTMSMTLLTLGLAICLHIFCVVLGYFLFKYILKVKPQEDLGAYVYSFGSFNSAFMGFPITLALFGQEILYLMVVLNSILCFYMYTFGPILLQIGSGCERKNEANLQKILSTLKNPNTIAITIGLIMLFSGLHLPETLFNCMDSLGSATVPLSMLVVGIQLGESNLKAILKNRNMVITSLLKVFVLPVIVFLILNWMPIDDSIKLCVVFSTAFPAAVAIVSVAAVEKKNAGLLAELTAFTTALSVASIPICAMLLTWYYGV